MRFAEANLEIFSIIVPVCSFCFIGPLIIIIIFKGCKIFFWIFIGIKKPCRLRQGFHLASVYRAKHDSTLGTKCIAGDVIEP